MTNDTSKAAAPVIGLGAIHLYLSAAFEVAQELRAAKGSAVALGDLVLTLGSALAQADTAFVNATVELEEML